MPATVAQDAAFEKLSAIFAAYAPPARSNHPGHTKPAAQDFTPSMASVSILGAGRHIGCVLRQAELKDEAEALDETLVDLALAAENNDVMRIHIGLAALAEQRQSLLNAWKYQQVKLDDPARAGRIHKLYVDFCDQTGFQSWPYETEAKGQIVPDAFA